MDILRLTDGHVAEAWSEFDQADILRQVGVGG